MQQPGQQPLRPVPVQGSSELQQLLDLVRLGNLHTGRSAFNSVSNGQPPFMPEFSLYNAAQLSGLLSNHSQQQQQQGGQADQLAQFQQWQTLQNQQNQANAAALFGSGQPAVPETSMSRSSLPKANSRGDKSSNAYATRHQAAEQRRRTRINDRLERLREVVPHSERANTATFLEEVIKYVEALKDRMTALERSQNVPLTCLPGSKEMPNVSQGCPTCALHRLCPNIDLSKLQAPYQTSAPQEISYQPALVPAELPSIPASTPAPKDEKETPDTPPQSQGRDEGKEAETSSPADALPVDSEGGVPDTDDEPITKKAKF